MVGEASQQFAHIQQLPMMDEPGCAGLFRSHDLFIAACWSEAGCHAARAALACGLPVLHVNEGSYGELVGFGGLSFLGSSDVLVQLDRIASNLEAFRSCIWMQSIDEIAGRYIELARRLLAE